jgi:hypothetical protein
VVVDVVAASQLLGKDGEAWVVAVVVVAADRRRRRPNRQLLLNHGMLLWWSDGAARYSAAAVVGDTSAGVADAMTVDPDVAAAAVVVGHWAVEMDPYIAQSPPCRAFSAVCQPRQTITPTESGINAVFLILFTNSTK